MHCEQKLGKISLNVQRVEILLRILEGKLDSIDWLPKSNKSAEKAATPAPAASGVPAPPASGVPPPPAGVPPPPGSGVPATPGPVATPAAPVPAAPASVPAQDGPKLKDDPRFVK